MLLLTRSESFFRYITDTDDATTEIIEESKLKKLLSDGCVVIDNVAYNPRHGTCTVYKSYGEGTPLVFKTIETAIYVPRDKSGISLLLGGVLYYLDEADYISHFYFSNGIQKNKDLIDLEVIYQNAINFHYRGNIVTGELYQTENGGIACTPVKEIPRGSYTLTSFLRQFIF